MQPLRQRMVLGFLWVVLSTLLISYGALIVISIFKDPFASLAVALLRAFTNQPRDVAVSLYRAFFSDQKFFWMLVLLALVFFVRMLGYLNRYAAYFGQVEDKLGELLEEPAHPQELPSSLLFLEERVQRIKDELFHRQLEAQQSEQRKNDLVVYLAHDIKTPLTSVIGYLSLLQEAPDMPAAQRAKYTDITLDKAHRLEDLINEFFDITRFNLQHITLEKAPLRLDVMLAQLADEFYPALAAQNKTALVEVEPGLTLYADPDKLARVLHNVLKNAVAYSDEGTQVRITAWKIGGDLYITIANQGRTIPPRQLESIFEKFFRLDEARSTNQGGAGLGLAIAKEIVTLHGGQISAQSESGCTTFTICLPADAESFGLL